MSAERDQAVRHLKWLRERRDWNIEELRQEARDLTVDYRLGISADQLLALAVPPTLLGFGEVTVVKVPVCECDDDRCDSCRTERIVAHGMRALTGGAS